MKHTVYLFAACLMLLASLPAAADTLKICFHYGCKAETAVNVSAVVKQQLAARFAGVADAAAEREAVRDAVQQLYLNAGRQSPIYQDKGGNFSDGTAEGRMDCVDHSSNSTTFLNYLAAQGWLKFHSVGKPVYRLPRIIDLHYAAQLIENENGGKWVVDSWFEDFGAAPAIVDWPAWKKGWRPSDAHAQK
ncbi:hypothetical protein LVJ83_02385 [Uruburuella testudinis]|uniref:Uncharacterized protein n=1 Tax=Uruburuella testudinis TaxID=1282863 RepID=A0ABY4DTZ3_9NEIS|nr:hypothetical protein [Uruburuella testudinis]UOO82343.1 hypothetical protein LVJ83_02385 [Uruburuella testudinis]